MIGTTNRSNLLHEGRHAAVLDELQQSTAQATGPGVSGTKNTKNSVSIKRLKHSNTYLIEKKHETQMHHYFIK